MMKEQDKRISVCSLAPLLLFLVFTTCIVIVLLTGADTYQNFTTRDQSCYERRTIVQYLTTRIRQSDGTDRIFVEKSGEGDTLFLCETLDGKTYHTRIYCHEGSLRELFCEEHITFAPIAGETILPCKNMQLDLSRDLLTILLTYPDDSSETLVLSLRSGKEYTYAH